MLTDNTLTIAISGTTSTSVNLGRISNPVLFRFPATTSTSFDIEVSFDDVTFEKLYDRFGNKVTIRPASGLIYLEPEVAVAIPQYIRLVGSAEAGGARTIKVFTRELV